MASPIELLSTELVLLKRSRMKSILSYELEEITEVVHKGHMTNLDPLIAEFAEALAPKMSWITIDPSNLPKYYVLAANFNKGTEHFRGKLEGKLYEDHLGISCESSNHEYLTRCTHYININNFDLCE